MAFRQVKPREMHSSSRSSALSRLFDANLSQCALRRSKAPALLCPVRRRAEHLHARAHAPLSTACAVRSRYWESSGTRPHHVELIGFGEGCQLVEWSLYHAFHDSYTPQEVVLKYKEVHDGPSDEWRVARTVTLEDPNQSSPQWVTLLGQVRGDWREIGGRLAGDWREIGGRLEGD